MEQKAPLLKVLDVTINTSQEEMIEIVKKSSVAQTNKLSPEEIQKSVVFKRFLGEQEGRTSKIAVLQIEKNLYDNFIKKGRIVVGWLSCRLAPFVSVNQCFKCLEFGHQARDCKNKLRCSHCSGAHRYPDCTNKETNPICSLCKQSGKQETGHTRTCDLNIKNLVKAAEMVVMNDIEDPT